ncbi:MAG: hypothetical protein AAF762_04930 [Pseudomonadota bacterium]
MTAWTPATRFAAADALYAFNEKASQRNPVVNIMVRKPNVPTWQPVDAATARD